MMNIRDYYDFLIDDGNDPVLDPPELKEYMNKWDGEEFIQAMRLDRCCSVLEIGVGTGRIAVRVLPLCKVLYGIDISPKTIKYVCGENIELYEDGEYAYIKDGKLHIETK